MNKRDLFQKTRSMPFLVKSSALLAILLLALGTGISFLNTQRLDRYQSIFSSSMPIELFGDAVDGDLIDGRVPADSVMQALVESLKSDVEFHVKMMDIADLFYYIEPDAPVTLPVIGNLNPHQQAIAEAMVTACSEENFEPLKILAENAAPPDANFALAVALENEGDKEGEISALYREVERYNPDYARERIVDIYLDMQKYDILDALARDEEYRVFFTAWVLQDIALSRLDWPMIFKTLIPAAYEDILPATVLLALLSGLIWTTVLIRFNGSFSEVWKFILPALVLGAVSAHATLLVVFWQEYQMDFGFGEGVYRQLLYCLSIGLKEEVLKLLLFVPLIPFLRRKSDLAVLTIAGLVGLGFAIEENINYFSASAGLSAVARFATANFLHIALTAMCGLTLTRAIYQRGEDIQYALTTLVLAVAVHGFYDAFMMVHAFQDYSWLTYTVFILMGYQYFGWLRHLREEWQDPFSITATFTFGVITVTGLSFALFAWYTGPYPAAQAVLGEAIGIAIILILFYREIPETVHGE
ncbi:PrsW family glutamic-type intramembrane protease [Pontiella sp. NLcol2]|uniref:PrsW family glutamic-type intramembrane protease n=2 Tax=Pontiella agarivorans TaxID=3038953 RepID=A0ABU5MWB8_9BACT|nr:PrsW family glutamic-type intramembrane protease [Pontiella agarivorans]